MFWCKYDSQKRKLAQCHETGHCCKKTENWGEQRPCVTHWLSRSHVRFCKLLPVSFWTPLPSLPHHAAVSPTTSPSPPQPSGTSDAVLRSLGLRMTCVKKKFKHFIHMSLKKFRPDNFIKSINVHDKLLSICPGSKRFVFTLKWHSSS